MNSSSQSFDLFVNGTDPENSRGTTAPGKGLAESIQEAEAAGATGPEIDALEKEWLEQHPLVTFNEGWTTRTVQLSDPDSVQSDSRQARHPTLEHRR